MNRKATLQNQTARLKNQAACPGCRMKMPPDESAAYDGYYDCSPECWGVYSEVLGQQFSNAIVFSHVHQLTVDAYALQHAGGKHKDKSVVIHLCGLHAAGVEKIPQMQIAGQLQKIASRVDHDLKLTWTTGLGRPKPAVKIFCRWRWPIRR
jgi:hypothetical protein